MSPEAVGLQGLVTTDKRRYGKLTGLPAQAGCRVTLLPLMRLLGTNRADNGGRGYKKPTVGYNYTIGHALG